MGGRKNYTQRHCNPVPGNKAWREARRQGRAVTYLGGKASRVTGTLSSQISGAVRRKGQHFSSAEKKICHPASYILKKGKGVKTFPGEGK